MGVKIDSGEDVDIEGVILITPPRRHRISDGEDVPVKEQEEDQNELRLCSWLVVTFIGHVREVEVDADPNHKEGVTTHLLSCVGVPKVRDVVSLEVLRVDDPFNKDIEDKILYD